MKHPLLKQNAEVPKEEVEAVSESSTSFVSKAASPQWDGWGPWRKRRQDFPTCVGKKGVSVFQIREIVVFLQSSVRRFCMRCFCLWVCVFMIYIYMFSTFSRFHTRAYAAFYCWCDMCWHMKICAVFWLFDSRVDVCCFWSLGVRWF